MKLHWKLMALAGDVDCRVVVNIQGWQIGLER